MSIIGGVTQRLHCYSFHSVKGGVGKSTLSTFFAHAMAQHMPTTLVDMDLTGTSLADVLPLFAPRWLTQVDLTQAPDDGFYDRDATLELIRDRDDPGTRVVTLPPFLNDFLLYEPAHRDEACDVHADALRWKLQGGPPGLRVIPSSALPGDVEQILPVIFDEEYAAFLEGRLEFLLDSLLATSVRDEQDQAIVFDTPPTIPGLSRTVLSLAMRLGNGAKEPLATDDPFIPDHLDQADLRWTIYMIVTPDLQDLRAAQRWLELVQPGERAQFRVVVNRTRLADEGDIRKNLRLKLERDGLIALDNFEMIPVAEQTLLQFFRDEGVPPSRQALFEKLRGQTP